MKALLVLVPLLGGCAAGVGSLTKDIALGSCVTIKTGSLAVTNSAGQTLISKPSDTIVFCPPAVIPNAPAAAASGAGA